MSLKFGILGLLNYFPMTGYKLKKTFDKSVNNIWTASLSQIYRELNTLEKEQHVSSHIEEQDDRPDKKVYSITEEGREIFRKWLEEGTDTFLSPKRDEFMLRIFFGASLGRPVVKNMIERFREDRIKAVKLLEEDTKVIPQITKEAYEQYGGLMEDTELFIGFIVDRAKMSNEVLIKWADQCLARLEPDRSTEIQKK